MRLFSNLRSARWNAWVSCALVVALVTGVGIGIALTTAKVEAQAARTFSGGQGMMLNYVKNGSRADFELVMNRLGEALQAGNSERQQQASGWKVYRAQEAGQNNSTLYVWFIDPVVPGADYTVSQILNDAFPSEVQDLYTRFSNSFAGGQSMVNLDLIGDF